MKRWGLMDRMTVDQVRSATTLTKSDGTRPLSDLTENIRRALVSRFSAPVISRISDFLHRLCLPIDKKRSRPTRICRKRLALSCVLLLVCHESLAQTAAGYYNLSGYFSVAPPLAAPPITTQPPACNLQSNHFILTSGASVAAGLAEVEAVLSPLESACAAVLNAELASSVAPCALPISPVVPPAFQAYGDTGIESGENELQSYAESVADGQWYCNYPLEGDQAGVTGTVGIWICPAGTTPVLSGDSGNCALAPLAFTLVDPVADGLASGTSIVNNPPRVAAATHVITGVAGDNATHAVVRVAGVAIGEPVHLVLSDEDGPTTDASGAGYLSPLPATGTTSVSSGGALDLTAVDAGDGTGIALAVYVAPTDFVRPSHAGDQQSKLRSVSIRATDAPTGRTSIQTVNIVRPPVVLVHGLFGEPGDFVAGGSGIYGAIESSRLFSEVAFARYDQPVTLDASNPSYGGNDFDVKGNTLGFLYDANVILPKLEAVVKDYAGRNPSGGSIATVQVDIVAHSMGGDVTRTLPQIPGYADQKTYEVGYVHKLITIDTPHLGSPLATELHNPDDNNLCVQAFLGLQGNYSFLNVQLISGQLIDGATGDLQIGSNAIRLIHTGAPVIPTAMIGGVASTAQIAAAGSTIAARILRTACFSNPLAQYLNSTNWLAFMGGPSDAIVRVQSEFDGDDSYSNAANTFQGVVHGSGAEGLGFSPPSVLDYPTADPTATAGAAVVQLLNTPVSNTAIFEMKP